MKEKYNECNRNNLNHTLKNMIQVTWENQCAIINMGGEGQFRIDPNSGEIAHFDIYSVELNIKIGTGRMSEIASIINAFLIGRKINK